MLMGLLGSSRLLTYLMHAASVTPPSQVYGRYPVALSESELEHLERLARVKLNDESREKLRGQLARIIEFVKQLEAIDTAGIEPRAYVGEFKPKLRADATKPCLRREEVLAASPENHNGFFAVPPVIEADELEGGIPVS
jgi:aspartyl-tRNA(Asn)/glutamyl-tRNA(Gln) amidotransferase subunit C